MTQNIIVDTSALIAFFVKSETHHQRAKKSETPLFRAETRLIGVLRKRIYCM